MASRIYIPELQRKYHERKPSLEMNPDSSRWSSGVIRWFVDFDDEIVPIIAKGNRFEGITAET